jgi:phosphoribosylformimino-5-aminoimidazole carboxamide ribotide isomerase
MIVYPAIDLLGGQVVRLRQGDPSQPTTVGTDAVAIARRWEREGARWLHVVDLDAALKGRPHHLELVRRICRAVNIPVQVGGGVRTLDDASTLFGAGAARVIIGTAALTGPLAAQAAARFGDRLAVALDVRDGLLVIEGWQRRPAVPVSPLDAARALAAAGVARFIYTDVAKDGMLAGPNLEGLRHLVATVGAPVIASGGVATVEDLRAVRAAGAEGAIIGRALYDGRLPFAEALAAAADQA